MSEVVEITLPEVPVVEVAPSDPPLLEFYVMQGPKGEPGTRIVGFSIGDGISTISPGKHTKIQVPFACSIASWTMMAEEPAGDIVVDVWKTAFANLPGSAADSICASAKPSITNDIKATDSALTGWTTTIEAGAVLTPNVELGATLKRVTLQFVINPTS